MNASRSHPRRIELEGAHNFRDLGGYPTVDGGQTRWGLVFRADGLHAMTEADLLHYSTLDIGTVFDLRRDDERERAPDPVASRQVSLISQAATGEGLPPGDPPQLAEEGERFLYDVYVGVLANAAEGLGEVLGTIARVDHAVLFHCTAGKDRTGVTAALLLEVLGVDRETILDDYELSGEYWKPLEDGAFSESMLAWGVSPEAAAGMMGAPRWTMADALDEVDRDHGGAEQYLLTRAGLSTADIDRLRSRLVERI